jgi:hypothetical protein
VVHCAVEVQLWDGHLCIRQRRREHIPLIQNQHQTNRKTETKTETETERKRERERAIYLIIGEICHNI